MVLQTLLDNAATLALVATRIAGFVVASPFPGERVHPSARVAVVVVLGFLVAHSLPMPAHLPELGVGMVIPASIEFACGALIGACFRFLLAAAEVLGGAAAQSTGLGAAALYDPGLGTHDTAIGQVISLFAMMIAVAAGTHRVAIAYLVESFRVLPIGGPTNVALGAPVLVDLAGQCLVIGVRLALPAIAISLAAQAALAMIARAAPSLQIFNVGFSVLIASGLVAIAASLPAIATGLAEHLSQLGPAIDRLLGAVGGG